MNANVYLKSLSKNKNTLPAQRNDSAPHNKTIMAVDFLNCIKGEANWLQDREGDWFVFFFLGA